MIYNKGINMEPDDLVNLLYGTKTTFNKCAGYCHYHKLYMTVKIIKNKECLGRQCKNLEKLDHPYWTFKQNLKNKKKNKE